VKYALRVRHNVDNIAYLNSDQQYNDGIDPMNFVFFADKKDNAWEEDH